ncbi:hypothetical protein NC653_030972 [Populus alba x Populus x berolinensis]|uniref:Uncharacterized protein n=1 Tax=Populus alba x Populus x berolinensis TaxID=444605 RepID=A0AAD6LX84_9ROSI|nr:hypothetical protein NC653_030972 [Populus alba x Populus x berolinensis]
MRKYLPCCGTPFTRQKGPISIVSLSPFLLSSGHEFTAVENTSFFIHFVHTVTRRRFTAMETASGCHVQDKEKISRVLVDGISRDQIYVLHAGTVTLMMHSLYLITLTGHSNNIYRKCPGSRASLPPTSLYYYPYCIC